MGQKISFSSDYTKNCHPRILQRLMNMGMEQNVGYGTDDICKSAADKIRKACECPEAEVFFLVGGTQTNQTVIDMLLKPYQGVIAAQSGHIAVHEAGAIEFSGHKVLTLTPAGAETDTKKYGSEIGKINAKELKAYVETFYRDDSFEHIFLIPQNMEHFIQSKSLRLFPMYAESMRYLFSWMGQGWDMAL